MATALDASDPAGLLRQLETAAQILLAPPNVVSMGDRRSSEAVFMEFRKTRGPFALCRHILETSEVDYVLFEAAGLIKDGLVREWRSVSKGEVAAMREYLLAYVINRPILSGYVRERLVQVMAIIIKRQSVDDGGEDRAKVLSEVQRMITAAGATMQMQMVGCSVLAAIMQEYATTVKSADVGLAWEVHFRAKRQFELTDLKVIFQFCLQALKELCPILARDPRFAPELTNLVVRLTTLAETVLTWTFINVNLPKKLISVFEADQNPSLRPGATWKELILQPTIVELFFELHLKVRHDSELAHHTLNCLVQLSSLNGSAMTKKENRVGYLVNYLGHFLRLIDSLKALGSIRPMEALGCSNIVRKLMLFFPPAVLANVPEELLKAYLEQITELTCHFMKASSGSMETASLLDEDDRLIYAEAYEHMLEAWVSVLHETTNSFPDEFISKSAIQIFNTYMQCSLGAPDGIRKGDEDGEEIGETEEDDRLRFKDTLATIGALGREATSHSIPILAQLIEGRLSRLHGQMQRLISQNNKFIDGVLSDLYEDIHWLLLIAGNVLTLDTDGEAALIPSEVMRFSLERQSAGTNVEASLRVLASPGQHSAEVPGHEATDPVILLVSSVFRLAEVEKRASEAGFSSLLSPEVGRSIMWFIRRWVVTYLAVQETYYSELSLALVAAFGEGTDGARWTVNFLIEKIISNLTSPLNSEEKLVKDTVGLLVSLVDGKEKGRLVLKSEGLVRLVELESNDQLSALPSAAKRGIAKALVLAGGACEDQAARDRYWERTLRPLTHRFNGIIARPDLKKIYNEDKVRAAVVAILESFIGVIQGAQLSTVQQIFGGFLSPAMPNLVQLLGLYHNYSHVVELVLEVFAEAAKRMLCYLGTSDSRTLYQRSVEVIQMYASHNRGKVEKDAEEEQFRDLLLLMGLLTNLLSKDFIDLAPQEPDSKSEGRGDHQQQQPVSAAEVCLFGLNIVMPLMTLELLKFPSLCLQYFRTTTLVCEIYPEKICGLGDEMRRNLVLSLELGFTTLGVDAVFVLCSDFVQVLCQYIVRTPEKRDLPIFEAMRPFLKLTMDLILSQNINSELMPNACSMLYVLICCYQDTYRELVGFLVDSQADASNRERLVEAFGELTRNTPFTADRINRIRFRDNFEKFIVNVRGFLLVK